MGKATDRFRTWRGDRPERRLSFFPFAALSAFSIVVLPGQYVPVLFRHDVEFIGLSLVLLAMGAAVASAAAGRGAAQQGRSGAVTFRASGPPLVSLSLALAAVALYRITGGIGWPRWHLLTIAPLLVLLATVIGTYVGRFQARPTRLRGPARVLTLVSALAVGAAGIGLFESLKNWTAISYSIDDQSCERFEGILYCANPGYAPFINFWEDVVADVAAQIPPDNVPPDGVVAQPARDREHDDLAAMPLLDWGRGPGKGCRRARPGPRRRHVGTRPAKPHSGSLHDREPSSGDRRVLAGGSGLPRGAGTDGGPRNARGPGCRLDHRLDVRGTADTAADPRALRDAIACTPR